MCSCEFAIRSDRFGEISGKVIDTKTSSHCSSSGSSVCSPQFIHIELPYWDSDKSKKLFQRFKITGDHNHRKINLLPSLERMRYWDRVVDLRFSNELEIFKRELYVRSGPPIVVLTKQQKSAKHARERKRLIVKATPPWANRDNIKAIYAERDRLNRKITAKHLRYEVDHVIPLRGKNVCGLHVENNLEIVRKFENAKKYNFVPVF